MAGGSSHGRVDVMEPPTTDWTDPDSEDLDVPPSPKTGWWQRFKEWRERRKTAKAAKRAAKEEAYRKLLEEESRKPQSQWIGVILILLVLSVVIAGGIGAQKLYVVYIDWKGTPPPPTAIPGAIRGAEVVQTPDGNAAVDKDGDAAREAAREMAGANASTKPPTAVPPVAPRIPVGFSRLGLIGVSQEFDQTWHRGETRKVQLHAAATQFTVEFVGFVIEATFTVGQPICPVKKEGGDPLYEVKSVSLSPQGALTKIEFAMLPSPTTGKNPEQRLGNYTRQMLPWRFEISSDTPLGPKQIKLAAKARGVSDDLTINFDLVD